MAFHQIAQEKTFRFSCCHFTKTEIEAIRSRSRIENILYILSGLFRRHCLLRDNKLYIQNYLKHVNKDCFFFVFSFFTSDNWLLESTQWVGKRKTTGRKGEFSESIRNGKIVYAGATVASEGSSFRSRTRTFEEWTFIVDRKV